MDLCNNLLSLTVCRITVVKMSIYDLKSNAWELYLLINRNYHSRIILHRKTICIDDFVLKEVYKRTIVTKMSDINPN